jgi:sterol desaturase/sphingolipid hydroxylase (fatty acid hydroxylase superfamily)
MESLPGLAFLQDWLFESAVQPVLYALGLIGYDELAYNAVEFFLYGVAGIILVYVVLRPLENWRPVERWTDRRALRVDVLYTWLNRAGLLPFVFFLLLQPAIDAMNAALRLHDIIPPTLETWFPWLDAHPLAAFAIYVVVLDFVGYVRHRLQHHFHWWWALHSLHHSQRQLSLWADDRNHLLDDFIENAWIALIGLLIGTPPAQFMLIVIGTRMIESLSHANIRLHFGALGDRLLVSPRFHRTHHGIGIGHEGATQGCNFAVLFPIWDVVFGTARFRAPYTETGVRDQLEGTDYGEGFWRQQWLGFKRLASALGWKAA